MDEAGERQVSNFDVSIMLTNANWGWGTPDACTQLARYMDPLVRELTLFSPVTSSVVKGDFLDSIVPFWVPDYVKGRLCRNKTSYSYLKTLSEHRALSGLSSSSICWTFPPTTVDFIKRAKDRGSKIVLEFINTHTSFSRAVLFDEYERVGRVWPEGDQRINALEDDERLSLADAAFVPGKLIGPSIRKFFNNPPALLPASYGAPFRSPPKDLAVKKSARNFIFVGFDGFRKGLHVLLEAWASVRINGTLTIVGGVEPWIRERYGHLIDGSVKVIDISRDLDGILEKSDVFILPSIEEGDPLSTYLAASYGLPLVVTLVAGGCIAVADVNSCIVEPSDPVALANAISRLADDADLFSAMRVNSYRSSLQFTWQEAAKRRHSELKGAFGTLLHKSG